MFNDLVKVMVTITIVTLCGCGQKTVNQIVPENVPIPVACSPPSIVTPQWHVDRLKVDADNVDWLRAVLADLELSKGYINQLKAAIASC